MKPLLAGLEIGRAFGRAQTPCAVATNEVVDDGPGLDQRQAIGLDHRRLPKRVQGLQRGRRQARRGVARAMLNLVGQIQLFKQPQHTLRARLIEVVDDDHGR